MRVKELLPVEFSIGGIRMLDDFFLVPRLSEKAIIGATTMQKWRINLDFERDALVLRRGARKFRLVSLYHRPGRKRWR